MFVSKARDAPLLGTLLAWIRLDKTGRNKHSSLLVPFVSYEERVVKMVPGLDQLLQTRWKLSYFFKHSSLLLKEATFYNIRPWLVTICLCVAHLPNNRIAF